MPQSELHQFDLALCEYVGSVINAHLTDASPDATAWATWFQCVMGECPLLDFVRSPHDQKFLLNRCAFCKPHL